jgi:hypothetical protein
MNRRLSLLTFALVLLLASFARAGVQQFELNLLNQQAVIPATAIRRPARVCAWRGSEPLRNERWNEGRQP